MNQRLSREYDLRVMAELQRRQTRDRKDFYLVYRGVEIHIPGISVCLIYNDEVIHYGEIEEGMSIEELMIVVKTSVDGWILKGTI